MAFPPASRVPFQQQYGTFDETVHTVWLRVAILCAISALLPGIDIFALLLRQLDTFLEASDIAFDRDRYPHLPPLSQTELCQLIRSLLRCLPLLRTAIEQTASWYLDPISSPAHPSGRRSNLLILWRDHQHLDDLPVPPLAGEETRVPFPLDHPDNPPRSPTAQLWLRRLISSDFVATHFTNSPLVPHIRQLRTDVLEPSISDLRSTNEERTSLGIQSTPSEPSTSQQAL